MAPACKSVVPAAPSGDAITDYDRQHLALYAALLDAEDAGHNWQKAAASLMRIDPEATGSEACWCSHVERARWIIGDGLAEAVGAFGLDERSRRKLVRWPR